jgi:hypothetical protein
MRRAANFTDGFISAFHSSVPDESEPTIHTRPCIAVNLSDLAHFFEIKHLATGQRRLAQVEVSSFDNSKGTGNRCKIAISLIDTKKANEKRKVAISPVIANHRVLCESSEAAGETSPLLHCAHVNFGKPVPIDLDIVFPLLWKVFLCVNGPRRTHRNTCATADTVICLNEELRCRHTVSVSIFRVDGIYRTRVETRCVF